MIGTRAQEIKGQKEIPKLKGTLEVVQISPMLPTQNKQTRSQVTRHGAQVEHVIQLLIATKNL